MIIIVFLKIIATMIGIFCFLTPFILVSVYSINNNKLIYFIIKFGITIFISLCALGIFIAVGITGYFDPVILFLTKIFCPAGFDEITRSFVSGPGIEEGSVSINIIYVCSGELGKYRLKGPIVLLVGTIVFFIDTIIIQLLGFLTSFIFKKKKYNNKSDRILKKYIPHISIVLLIFITMFIVVKFDPFITPKITKEVNKILYPGQIVSIIEATRKKRMKLIKKLLNEKVDVLGRNENKESALSIANKMENKKILYLFTDYLEKNFPEKSELYKMNIYFNEDSFIEEIKKSNSLTVKLFLEGGISIRPKKKTLYFPLKTAVIAGDSYIVELLINYGANAKIKDLLHHDPKTSLLTTACEMSNVNVVNVLINNKAVINTKNKSGYTPLMAASKYGKIKIVKLLVENNSDIKASDTEKHNALFYAVFFSNENFLINKYNHGNSIVSLLIENGVDVDAQDKIGLSPLMYAVKESNIELVKQLLEKNADINMEGKYGDTALNIAEPIENQKIINLLLSAGASE